MLKLRVNYQFINTLYLIVCVPTYYVKGLRCFMMVYTCFNTVASRHNIFYKDEKRYKSANAPVCII